MPIRTWTVLIFIPIVNCPLPSSSHTSPPTLGGRSILPKQITQQCYFWARKLTQTFSIFPHVGHFLFCTSMVRSQTVAPHGPTGTSTSTSTSTTTTTTTTSTTSHGPGGTGTTSTTATTTPTSWTGGWHEETATCLLPFSRRGCGTTKNACQTGLHKSTTRHRTTTRHRRQWDRKFKNVEATSVTLPILWCCASSNGTEIRYLLPIPSALCNLLLNLGCKKPQSLELALQG